MRMSTTVSAANATAIGWMLAGGTGDEDDNRREAANDRSAEERALLERARPHLSRSVPGGKCEQDERQRPREVEERAFDVRVRRRLVEEHAVPDADHEQTESASRDHARPGLQRVTVKTKKTSASRSMSPIGYARFVSTTSGTPVRAVHDDRTSTAAATAAAVEAAITPSSQIVALNREMRLRSRSPIPR